MMIISTSGYDPLRVPVTVQHDMDEDEYPSGYVEQLEATNAELLEAAERVVERWDSPHWGWSDVHTSVLIHQLRAAIAKAKGEQL